VPIPCTWRLISLTISRNDKFPRSQRPPTATLAEASSDAAATGGGQASSERSAVADSVPAEDSSCVEADDTVCTISPIMLSKLRVYGVDPAAALELGFRVGSRGFVGCLTWRSALP